MFKTFLIAFALLVSTAVVPTSVSAAEKICVQGYGQPVVCGTTTPDYHPTFEAGLADMDLRVVSISFLLGSAILFAFSAKRSSLHR